MKNTKLLSSKNSIITRIFRTFTFLLLISTSLSSYSKKKQDQENIINTKPRVWIISDGCDPTLKQKSGRPMCDPDDISAIADYLIMSNNFRTEGIVIASEHKEDQKTTPSQLPWANNLFIKAYKEDLPNLNKYIGGYQNDIRFLESTFKAKPECFSWFKKYDINNYPSVNELYKTLSNSNEQLNILSWGSLTETSVLVRYLEQHNLTKELSKIRIISHWTNSSWRVGTIENPEDVHNTRDDIESCRYLKKMALNHKIQFYECGCIGQEGIVENAKFGDAYYNQFKISALGKVFAEGKLTQGRVDDSDAATFWVLLGNWGVSLNNVASNGINMPQIEKRNIESFAKAAPAIRNEIFRRVKCAAGFNPEAVSFPLIKHDSGMADPHVWIKNDTLFLFCGHDHSWNSNDWIMDHWERWITTDLRNWEHLGDILPTQTYIGNNYNCWACDIAVKDNKSYLYISNRNINTGVMTAPDLKGPWKDALGKPLLPSNIIPGHPYDPEIFVEDGEYYICFGAGQYYMAKLGKDMISLAEKPKAVKVFDKDGKRYTCDDKSTLFKRGDWYYLCFGSKYCMSKNLYGPYTYTGRLPSGGHCSIFNWHGQWYQIHESSDTNLFYRGVGLCPVYFNKDGTVFKEISNGLIKKPVRDWTFSNTQMGWHATHGTNLEWNSYGAIQGKFTSKNAMINSVFWLLSPIQKCKKLEISLKNNSAATKMRIGFYTKPRVPAIWKAYEPKADWSKAIWKTINIKPNSSESIKYEINLKDIKGFDDTLLQIGIMPGADTEKGKWMINQIKLN